MPNEAQPMEPQVQWTSRSVGSNFQYNIFYTLIRFGGPKAAYALLYGVALYYTLFKPELRKKANYYLLRRFETSHPFKKRLNTFRIYVNLGKALIDKAIFGIKGKAYIQIRFSEKYTVLDLINERHGLLLLTAHVGCWQAAMSALDFFNTPVSLLLHQEEGDLDLHYFEHSGGPPPFRIIDPLGYLGGVLEMMEVLKKGEILCLMGDRALGDEKNTVSVNFLGGSVRFPVSAFKLAAATGAPIAVIFSYKSGPDSYDLILSGIIRVPRHSGKSLTTLHPYVAQFVETLESYVQQFPFQFFNFYNMWEGDREDTFK